MYVGQHVVPILYRTQSALPIKRVPSKYIVPIYLVAYQLFLQHLLQYKLCTKFWCNTHIFCIAFGALQSLLALVNCICNIANCIMCITK